MNPDHYSRYGGHPNHNHYGHPHPHSHPPPPSRRQQMGYGVRYEDQGPPEGPPPPPPHPHQRSALDDCMNERTRRYPTRDPIQKPTSFYDSTYDDVLARKQEAYAPPAPRPRSGDETMIELGPGMYARLRGASETWYCIENDFHVPVVCFACSMELCCIQDADYVLCPGCKVVSPIEQTSKPFSVAHVTANDGGVGLGFTFEELFKWQAEIMRRRAESLHSRAPPQPREVYY